MVSADEWSSIRRKFAKLKQRMMGLITRARVGDSAVTSQGQVVGAKLLQGEARDGAEYFEPYGIAGAVPTGSTGLAFAVGGSRDQIVVLCASQKGGTPDGRLAGEVDIYSQHGQVIRLHTDGSISLQPADGGTVVLGGAPGAQPFVNRNGDSVTPDAQMATWMGAVQAALVACAGYINLQVPGSVVVPGPPPTTIGRTVATSTTTRIE